MNGEWHPAFVSNRFNKITFFVIIKHRISAVLYDLPDGTLGLGKFYEVQIVFNENAKATQTAQHRIINYREIPALASVEVDVNKKGPSRLIIKTTARILEETITFRHKELHNEQFGKFIDLNDIVECKGKLVEFFFKCIFSPIEKTSVIFAPIRIIRYLDFPPENVDQLLPQAKHVKVGGFVCSTLKDGYRHVWAKGLERDALLNEKYCPRQQDVEARWVEVNVNTLSNEVVDTVKIIDDIFPSRMKCETPEVLVTFKYDGFYKQGKYHIYYNEDFGLISDSDCIIRDVVENRRYSGWIVRHETNIVNCLWKVSSKQDHPVNINYQSTNCDNHPESKQWNISHNPQSSFNNSASLKRLSPDSNKITGNIFPDCNNSDEEEASSRAPTTDSENESISDYEHTILDQRQSYGKLRNREANQQGTTYSNSNINGLHKLEYGTRAEDVNTAVHRQDPEISMKNLSNPVRNRRADSPNIMYQSYFLLEQENRKLKLKLANISNIIQFFLEDSKVLEEVKLCDVEQYEELVKLISE